MSDLGWTADGIERAIAAGGVPLETYRRPGFCAGTGVRRSDGSGAGGGTPIDLDSWSRYKPENRHADRLPPR